MKNSQHHNDRMVKQSEKRVGRKEERSQQFSDFYVTVAGFKMRNA